MRIFFDNNFPPPLVTFLQYLSKHDNDGHTFDCVDFKYNGVDPGDEVWIADLEKENASLPDEENWVVCTKDVGSKDGVIIPLLEGSGLTTFFFRNRWNKMDAKETSWRIVKAISDIISAASKRPTRQFHRVKENGTVERID